MLFSSIFFLWVFLPITLIVYWLLPNIKTKNVWLLIASLLFYAWEEPKLILLMLAVVFVNYIGGISISKIDKNKKVVLAVIIVINIFILGYFKYFNLFVVTLNRIARHQMLQLRDIALPLGISFYIFQALSYTIDVYRKDISVQKNYFVLLLYVALFPQLIAGPIVRYKDVEEALRRRYADSSQIAYGIKRFCYGLGKKVILSNTLAAYASQIISMDANVSLYSTSALWFGAFLYTLQIYYDFSGYSDMAIGIGRMLGFTFHENFQYPYMAESIQDFWRRWHISLSSWFKEYVYIPLGGNRKGVFRTYINLVVVFFLTGLWHGASIAFIFWGLWHGLFMLLERAFLGNVLKKNPVKFANHIYTMFVVMVGWVFFDLGTFSVGALYIKRMFALCNGVYDAGDMISGKLLIVLFVSVLLSGIIQKIIPKLQEQTFNETEVKIWEILLCIAIMMVCFMLLVSNTYNPFIYFRF